MLEEVTAPRGLGEAGVEPCVRGVGAGGRQEDSLTWVIGWLWGFNGVARVRPMERACC